MKKLYMCVFLSVCTRACVSWCPRAYTFELCLCGGVYMPDFSERNITHDAEDPACLSLDDHTPEKQRNFIKLYPLYR